MTLHNTDDTTMDRRSVLKQLGAASVSAVGLVGASGTAAAACEFRWEVGMCLVTEVDGLPIVDGPCSNTQIGQAPQGARAIVKDVACCGPENATPFYYVDWCDSRIEDGWIRQDGLERTEECCETSCDFKWDQEACVEANAEPVGVSAEPCSPDQVGEVYEGAQGIVMRAFCCGEEIAREFYYVDWCDPDLVDGWVSQTDLRRSEDCCVNTDG